MSIHPIRKVLGAVNSGMADTVLFGNLISSFPFNGVTLTPFLWPAFRQLALLFLQRLFEVNRRKPDLSHPIHRVAVLLGLVRADRVHKTKVVHKYVDKLKEAFRRLEDMTKGQQAMAVAKIYPEPEKGGRGKNSVINTGFNASYVSHARTVLQYAPELG